jgi:hypothetical protein
VRGREDIMIGCLLAEVRALCGWMSTGLSTALTEDDETCRAHDQLWPWSGNLPVSPNFLLRIIAHQFRQCDRRSTQLEEQ